MSHWMFDQAKRWYVLAFFLRRGAPFRVAWEFARPGSGAVRPSENGYADVWPRQMAEAGQRMQEDTTP